MTELSRDELKKRYAVRRAKVAAYLKEHGVGAAVFIDSEERREPALRYFTGHPSDAALIIFEDGASVLIPWDEILAKSQASCGKLIPYARYRNNAVAAVQANLNAASRIENRRAELPPSTPYLQFLKFVDAVPGWDMKITEEGVHAYAVRLRAVKDEYEIACLKEAARIGDLIINRIEAEIGSIKTETDVALLIERECRAHGCERTGFDTLAAGPERSWAIHCFPNYTAGAWPGGGLSILDFGVVCNGYTSDTTLTVAKGPLSDGQERLLALVQKAADECLPLYRKGVPLRTAAEKADAVFAAAKRKMPHTLGHGIGLEVHEYPRVSAAMPESAVFEAGMVVTLEPGLYDEALGGCRLENDVLITEAGSEVISHSRIIRI